MDGWCFGVKLTQEMAVEGGKEDLELLEPWECMEEVEGLGRHAGRALGRWWPDTWRT